MHGATDSAVVPARYGEDGWREYAADAQKEKARSRRSKRGCGLLKGTLAATYSPTQQMCSTIGAKELNFRVRDGIGCGLLAIATGEIFRLNADCSALLRACILGRLRSYSAESSSTYPRGTTAGTHPPCEHFRPNLQPLATASQSPFRPGPEGKEPTKRCGDAQLQVNPKRVK